MAYYNNKKVVFSPHVHLGAETETITVKISIDPESRGAYVGFNVYGSKINENGEITEYSSAFINDELQGDFLKHSCLVIRASSGLSQDFSDLPTINSSGDILAYFVDDREIPSQDVFEIQLVQE